MRGVTGPRRIHSYFCYAESADGVIWEKPTLDLYEYEAMAWNGKRIGGANNIIPGGKPAVLDPHDPDPNRRYKAQRHADSTHMQTEKFAVSPATSSIGSGSIRRASQVEAPRRSPTTSKGSCSS